VADVGSKRISVLIGRPLPLGHIRVPRAHELVLHMLEALVEGEPVRRHTSRALSGKDEPRGRCADWLDRWAEDKQERSKRFVLLVLSALSLPSKLSENGHISMLFALNFVCKYERFGGCTYFPAYCLF
jgi:hypothetical protein